MKRLLLAFCGLFAVSAQAQVWQDHFGAGQDNGITVTSSSQSSGTSDAATINGMGLDQHLKDASRFLGQASLGADMETIEAVASIGPEMWIEQQFEMPMVSYLDTTVMIWDHFVDAYVDQWGEDQIIGNGMIFPVSPYWRMAWWNNTMKSEDQLRQRAAFALSEIFVISEKSQLDISAHGLADYYDVLYSNAFGNFRDLLEEVTLHPSMGFYLTHLNNERSDPENNIQPDENYAREVMQLFTIGLYEMNTDGTYVLDENDERISTYDNNDIQEFAKVFTGLGPAEYWWHWEDISFLPVQWNSPDNTVGTINMMMPMEMYEEWHEPGEKYLLNGQVVPAGQTGMEDIQDALDNLFNHPNVGPFIGRQLIQRLVKSNPTPDYVERVAMAFNDNGDGVRGDMKAVIRAVLLDPEARDCEWIAQDASGKLREPLVRYTQIMRGFNATNESGRMWNVGGLLEASTAQHPLGAPSVFNFFLPTHAPHGPIFDAGLVAPEFEILTSATAINWVNLMYIALLSDYYMEVSTIPSVAEVGIPEFDPGAWLPEDHVNLDLSDEFGLANNADALVDRLDLLLTGGIMGQESKDTISDAVALLNLFDANAAVKAGIFLTLISPDYVIQK